MEGADVLVDGFDRIHGVVHRVVDGARMADLTLRPDNDGNSIVWLIWHLARVQDDHVADAAGTYQVWTNDGWAEKFALPLDADDTGYGHGSAEVSAVRVDSPELLLGYYDAVHQRTRDYVRTLSSQDLDRIVDESRNPAVTLGVRLMSVITDDLQHAGQAAYVRGLVHARH